MPLYTPEDPEFATLEARHAWFDAVLQAECGELEGSDDGAPEGLNWLSLAPTARALDIAETECSLAWVAPSGYTCTVWDVTGDEDDPLWAVFLVDDAGPRLLSDLSTFDEDADDAAVDALLEKGARELPDRLLSGAYDRDAPPQQIPDWLRDPRPKPDL